MRFNTRCLLKTTGENNHNVGPLNDDGARHLESKGCVPFAVRAGFCGTRPTADVLYTLLPSDDDFEPSVDIHRFQRNRRPRRA